MMYTNIKYIHITQSYFRNAQKDVCKTSAIGQFDRYGREGVKYIFRN